MLSLSSLTCLPTSTDSSYSYRYCYCYCSSYRIYLPPELLSLTLGCAALHYLALARRQPEPGLRDCLYSTWSPNPLPFRNRHCLTQSDGEAARLSPRKLELNLPTCFVWLTAQSWPAICAQSQTSAPPRPGQSDVSRSAPASRHSVQPATSLISDFIMPPRLSLTHSLTTRSRHSSIGVTGWVFLLKPNQKKNPKKKKSLYVNYPVPANPPSIRLLQRGCHGAKLPRRDKNQGDLMSINPSDQVTSRATAAPPRRNCFSSRMHSFARLIHLLRDVFKPNRKVSIMPYGLKVTVACDVNKSE